MKVSIEPMQAQDWTGVRMIYEQGIASGYATFETAVPEWSYWDAKHLTHPRLIARSEHDIVGWAALSPVSTRPVYAGVAEVSVYIALAARRQGVGRLLLSELIVASEDVGIWTLQAVIFPENQGSINLHEECGFRLVGRRERLGQLHGVWHDVLLFERRSKRVGL